MTDDQRLKSDQLLRDDFQRAWGDLSRAKEAAHKAGEYFVRVGEGLKKAPATIVLPDDGFLRVDGDSVQIDREWFLREIVDLVTAVRDADAECRRLQTVGRERGLLLG